MNEKLETALTEIITKAVSGIDAASGFILSEAPEVIQQLIKFKLFECLVGVIVGAALAFILGYIAYRLIIYRDTDGDVSPVSMFAIAPVFFGFIFSMNTYLAFLELIKVWLAPKVWLIEYAANLVK